MQRSKRGKGSHGDTKTRKSHGAMGLAAIKFQDAIRNVPTRIGLTEIATLEVPQGENPAGWGIVGV